MTFDKICNEFRMSVPVNSSDARDVIEKVILAVHKEHIFSFYQPSDPNRPSLSLLLGVRCSNDELTLIKTQDTATHIGGMYEVTGMGQPLFEYWAKYFYRDNLDLEVMSYLALFMLREVKNSSSYCGGSSQVFKLAKVRPTVRKGSIYSENDLMVGFPDSVVRILSVLTDLSVSDAWIEAKLKEFSERVIAVRVSLKSQAVSDAIMRKMMDDANSKLQSTSQK